MRRSGRVGSGIGRTTRWVWLDALKHAGVETRTGLSYRRITPEGVEIELEDGTVETIAADRVVIAAGQERRDELRPLLERLEVPHRVVGGAENPSELNAVRAFADGLRAAYDAGRASVAERRERRDAPRSRTGPRTPSAVSNCSSAARISAAIRGRISSARSPQRRSTSPAGPIDIVRSTASSSVVAHPQRQVAAAQLDRLEAGDRQLLADRVGVRHRERARAAGRLVGLLGVLEVLLDHLLGLPDPAVVELAPPDDGAEPRPRRASRARMLRSAATGLAKNITPIREKT